MLLSSILTEANSHKGTYAGVRFDKGTCDKISKYIKDNDIPNKVPVKKLHTTLLYSRKHLPDYQARGSLNTPLTGKPMELDVWESSGKERNQPTTRCLVLKYNSPELVKRHNQLMKTHNATYDFDEYIPHVTLSYDIGDLELEHFTDPKTIIDTIVIDEEYQEELDLDWAKNNT